MQAFHNNPKIKADLVAQLEAHYAADEFIQGKYWENGKGCAVGCCVHSNDHGLFPERFGIPESIAYLMDGIFEGLPNKDAKEFPLRLIKSIEIGADLSKVENLFLEWLLIDPTHGVIRFNADPCIPAVAALHRNVADGNAVSPAAWSAASDAARAAAWSAAWSAASDAARAADWSAARAAVSAAARAADWSAVSAAVSAAVSDAARAAVRAAAWSAVSDAAWSAVSDAAWAAQAQKLIELLAAAPILLAA